MKKILFLLIWVAFLASQVQAQEQTYRYSKADFKSEPDVVGIYYGQVSSIPSIYEISKGAYEILVLLIDKRNDQEGPTQIRFKNNRESSAYNFTVGAFAIFTNQNDIQILTNIINDRKVAIITLAREADKERTIYTLVWDYKKNLKAEEKAIIDEIFRKKELMKKASGKEKNTFRKEISDLKKSFSILIVQNERAVVVFEKHLRARKEIFYRVQAVNSKDAFFASEQYPDTTYGKMVIIPGVIPGKISPQKKSSETELENKVEEENDSPIIIDDDLPKIFDEEKVKEKEEADRQTEEEKKKEVVHQDD